MRAIVLTGAGRGFCAGADMARLSSAATGAGGLPEVPDTPQDDGIAANFAQRYSYLLAIEKPVIAAINGAVAGVGLVVTLYCDIRYMAEGAKLTTAFARRGLIAEHGAAWMLPRLIGPMNALDLLYSARVLEAQEAAAPGARANAAGRWIPRGGAGARGRTRQPLLAALDAHHEAAGLRGDVPVARGGHRDRRSRTAALPRDRRLPRGRRALRREAAAELLRTLAALPLAPERGRATFTFAGTEGGTRMAG